jgi:hypothetical protein
MVLLELSLNMIPYLFKSREQIGWHMDVQTVKVQELAAQGIILFLLFLTALESQLLTIRMM